MIVGLAGAARSGKDTVANFLTVNCGFQRVAFADALKAVAEELNPVLMTMTNEPPRALTLSEWREAGYDDEMLKDRTDYRGFLVALGAGARRHLGAYVWVRPVVSQIDNAPSPARWVIPDVRYVNEAVAIRARGGTSFLLKRPGYPPINHEERKSLAKLEYLPCILNDGSIPELLDKVRTELNLQ